MAHPSPLPVAALLLVLLIGLAHTVGADDSYQYTISRRSAKAITGATYSSTVDACRALGMYIFVDQNSAEHAAMSSALADVASSSKYYAYMGGTMITSQTKGSCPEYKKIGDMIATTNCYYSWVVGAWSGSVQFYIGNRPPAVLSGSKMVNGFTNFWMKDSSGAQMAPRQFMMLYTVLLKWSNMTSAGWSDNQGAKGYYYSSATGKEITSFLAACIIDVAADANLTTLTPYVDTRSWAAKNWWVILIIVLVIVVVAIVVIIIVCCLCCCSNKEVDSVFPMVVRYYVEGDGEEEVVEDVHYVKRRSMYGGNEEYGVMDVMGMDPQMGYADEEAPIAPMVFNADPVNVSAYNDMEAQY